MFKLPETKQEVFDIVCKHLLTQKSRCQDESGGCKYRFNGLKCAAGIFIPDSCYKPSFEGRPWFALISMYLVPPDHASLIVELQRVHDNNNTSEWENKLRVVALEFNLSTDVIYKTLKGL